MSSSPADLHQEELLAWAERGTIVTRTRRLAREIQSTIGQANARAGAAVFKTPEVLPVEAWFKQQWDALDHELERLSDSAELLLWRDVIAADLAAERSGEQALHSQVTELASASSGAWKQMRRWQEPIWDRVPLVPDVEAFRRWSVALRERLGGQWITSAELPDRLAEQADAVRVAVGDDIVFAGFERIEPALRRLIDALQDRGVRVVEADPAGREPAAVSLVPAATLDREVRLLASNVRADIERDPSMNIGILAADLSSYRATLERHLGAELDAASLVPTVEGGFKPQRRVFDLAGAPALSDYAIVAHALDLLRLGLRDNTFEDVSTLLLAPFPRCIDAAQRELVAAQRARVEVKLRRDNRMTVSLDMLASVCSEVGAPDFSASVSKLIDVVARTPRRAQPSAWKRHFLDRLSCFGWPGAGIDRDSDEGVAFGRWRDVIDEFAALDAVCDAMTLEQARAELRRACRDVAVQAPSGGLGVQAMGLLDAAGLDFDKVYVVGMTADVFPAPTRPHPLLPAEWQRTAGFPLASPEAEAEFAATVWRRVGSCCAELVVSWPTTGARGETFVPSPVLGRDADAVQYEMDEDRAQPAQPGSPGSPGSPGLPGLPGIPWYARPVALAGIEFASADTGEVPPALIRSGGTALLTDHSACPFRSFAAWRLKAREYDELEAEPKATLRGDLVHVALEHAWREIVESSTLRSLDEAALSAHVSSAVDAAIGERFPDSPESLHAPLVDWLRQQVGAWLAFEQTVERDDWRVGATEEHAEVPLGRYGDTPAVTLRGLKIDRIDVLADGSELVIDYKTASALLTTSRWLGERPKDPQLPIYAVALAEQERRVAGVAFATLASRDKLGLRGIADDEIIKTHVAPPRGKAAADWSGMQAHIDGWRATLSALAEDYAGGNASVSPRSQSADCKFCRREPLCRIFEAVDLREETQDEDA